MIHRPIARSKNSNRNNRLDRRIINLVAMRRITPIVCLKSRGIGVISARSKG